MAIKIILLLSLLLTPIGARAVDYKTSIPLKESSDVQIFSYETGQISCKITVTTSKIHRTRRSTYTTTQLSRVGKVTVPINTTRTMTTTTSGSKTIPAISCIKNN